MYAVCKVSVNVCSVCERLVNVCSVCERLNAGFSVWSVSCCVSCVKCQLTCAARGASTSAFRMWVARWAAILWLRLFLLEKCSHGRKKKKKLTWTRISSKHIRSPQCDEWFHLASGKGSHWWRGYRNQFHGDKPTRIIRLRPLVFLHISHRALKKNVTVLTSWSVIE